MFIQKHKKGKSNKNKKTFQVFSGGKAKFHKFSPQFMCWLCVVVSVDSYIFAAQITAVAKIACLARTQIHGYCVLGLRDDLTRLFYIEFSRGTIVKNGYVAEFAGELIWVQLYAC
jgi:hypothetical protein